MDFYIPISSIDSIVQKNPSSFQIFLPQRITLQGSYEIALREISFPNNLLTLVTEKDSEIIIQLNGTKDKHVIHLPRRKYSSVIELVEQINEDLLDYSYSMKVEVLGNGFVKVFAIGGIITFSPLLRDILGLKNEVVNNVEMESMCVANLFQQHNFLNVCTDLVQPLCYAKKQRQLLRRIGYTNVQGRYVEKTFDNPIYFPLSRKDFETITIQITNDYGNPISFDRGTVFILLHVRQRTGFDNV